MNQSGDKKVRFGMPKHSNNGDTVMFIIKCRIILFKYTQVPILSKMKLLETNLPILFLFSTIIARRKISGFMIFNFYL